MGERFTRPLAVRFEPLEPTMANKKQTSCKVASQAARTLASPNASKKAKSLAGSALSQARKGCDRKK